jgi:hypothetical protein
LRRKAATHIAARHSGEIAYISISYTKAGKSVKWLEGLKQVFELFLREFSVNLKVQNHNYKIWKIEGVPNGKM